MSSTPMSDDILRARGHGARVMVTGRAIGPRIVRLHSGDPLGCLELEQGGGGHIVLFVLRPVPIEPGRTLLAEARVNIGDGKVAAVTDSRAVVAL